MLPDPYYADDSVTLYHADCMEILPHLVGTADLVFTSPPYNKGGGSSTGREWSALANGYGCHDDAMADGDYVAWQQAVVAAAYDATTPAGALFYQHKPLAKQGRVVLPTRLVPDGLAVRQIVTWDRGSGFQRDGYHLCPEYEWVLIVARPDWRVADRSVGDVWRVAPDCRSAHPAPFPLGLPATAIRAAAPRTVLDPFAGSGTTLRAAKNAGCAAVGIELDERFCEMAATRLAQEVLAL